MKTGQSTINEFFKTKIIEPSLLEKKLEEARKNGKTIATLNGSFDLLHAGHLYIIFEASKTADILVLALNTDASIQRYKSPSRPIIPLEYRLQAIAALSLVDYVTWFDEDDPRELLTKLRPDVHVNGAEYGENCIEAQTVRNIGGRLHLVPKIEGLSTSALVEKIKKL